MPVSTLVETFASAASAASTVERTGLPDPLKVIIATCTARVSAAEGIARLDIKPGFGVATSTSNRFCVGSQNDDGGGTMSCDKIHRNDAIVGTSTNGGVLDRLVDISAFTDNTATFIVDDAGSVAIALTTFYLGGTDFTNAEVFQFEQATSAQAQVVTLPFADPNCLLFFSCCGAHDINTIEGTAAMMIGACVKNADGTLTQAVSTTIAIDAGTDSNTARYSRSGQCCAAIDPADVSTLAARGAVTAISGTDLTITWAEADATARKIFCLAMAGPQFAIRTFTTKTDTSTIIPVVVNFTPQGGMLVSVSDAEHADDTPSAGDQLSVGFFSDATTRQSIMTVNVDAVPTSISSGGHSTDEALAAVSVDAVPVVEYEIDISSIDGNGVNFVHDTAAASEKFVWALITGNEGDGGVPTTPVMPLYWRW